MSKNAKRYHRYNEDTSEFPFERLSGSGFHHIPPKCPDKKPVFNKQEGRMVSKKSHAAYHLIFHNAATFEEAVEILWNDWWNKDTNEDKGA